MKKLIIPTLIVFVLSASWLLFSKPADKAKKSTVKEAAESVQLNNATFNDYLISTLDQYAVDGRYPYKWIGGYSGVSQNLYYDQTCIANANPDGSQSTYCCGLTFEAYFRTLMTIRKELGLGENIKGMTADDFKEFLSLWFVKEKFGDGPGAALTAYGLGETISKMADVKKGDFVQIWRTSGSGHSVIFINWIISDEGDTTGMKYWSTQPGTKGLNYNTEYFNGYGGKVDKANTHYSRAYLPTDPKEQ